MENKDYIMYLNSLHNYNAQNKNAYGEKNVNNPYANEIMVNVGLCDFIYNKLYNDEAHVLILTGHAGDGKTSIMYQVLTKLGVKYDIKEQICDIEFAGNKLCRCIKDFSELSNNDKLQVLKESVNMPNAGNYVFMVANTGPLINTFGELFDDPKDRELAKIELIDAMDGNTGDIKEIKGYKICVINVANVDNTYFAGEFLSNIIKDSLWSRCDECSKKEYCHILRNKKLISSYKEKVLDFIEKHYIWLTEYGKRLTIRSMTEQIAFMVTGGFNCSEVEKQDEYMLLFSNLFFGYTGIRENAKAENILAVKEAKECSYYLKRLRSDEKLLVDRNYETIFASEVLDIINKAEKKIGELKGWTEFLRRTYMFMNVVTDKEILENDCEDIFSKQFMGYLRIRNGDKSTLKATLPLISDALSMIYIGTTNNEQQIPITLSRNSGISQNVQLITGVIYTRKMKLNLKQTRDSKLNSKKERYILKLSVEGKELDCEISLPLLDYFEELKNGVISTNVDPKLTYGVESLKAELSEKLADEDDLFEMIVLKNTGSVQIKIENDIDAE